MAVFFSLSNERAHFTRQCFRKFHSTVDVLHLRGPFYFFFWPLAIFVRDGFGFKAI